MLPWLTRMEQVSILALPEGRALLGAHAVGADQGVSILALPEGRALRSLVVFAWLPPSLLFQSSPFPKEGRYSAADSNLNTYGSFNPRPSRRKGATHLCVDRAGRRRVSILALPEGRALHHAVELIGCLDAFQSSPFPKEGRYCVPTTTALYAHSFQSSPFPKEGRYSDASSFWSSMGVSILALPEGRALPSWGAA